MPQPGFGPVGAFLCAGGPVLYSIGGRWWRGGRVGLPGGGVTTSSAVFSPQREGFGGGDTSSVKNRRFLTASPRGEALGGKIGAGVGK